MGRWTDAVCEGLARSLPIPSPAGTEYYQLTHLSYVREEEEGWTMHRPVAQVRAGSLSPALRERLISALLNLAEEDLAALDILEGMARAVHDCRTAQAMQRQARADCGAGRNRPSPFGGRWGSNTPSSMGRAWPRWRISCGNS